MVFPFPTTRQEFALCLEWVKVSVEETAALARRGALRGVCSSLRCPLIQFQGLSQPKVRALPSFPKTKAKQKHKQCSKV